MPKVTYPRECPTCGKEFIRGYFFHHKKHCGTTEHRYHCPLCPLSFSQYGNMQHHIRQQHSNNPLRFVCSMCGTELTTAHKMRLHMATVCAEQKLRYNCWYCNAAFTRKDNRQTHMRCIHGPICREKKDNLQLYLQPFQVKNRIFRTSGCFWNPDLLNEENTTSVPAVKHRYSPTFLSRTRSTAIAPL